MIRPAIAAALLIATAASAQPSLQGSPELQALMGECRHLSLVGDGPALQRYVDGLMADRQHHQGEIIACSAYLAGVLDASAGYYESLRAASAPHS